MPFALRHAYRPRDNSESPSADVWFIKSFIRPFFKSASICLPGQEKERNVKEEESWRRCGRYLWVFVLLPLIPFPLALLTSCLDLGKFG